MDTTTTTTTTADASISTDDSSIEWNDLVSLKGQNPDLRNIQGELSQEGSSKNVVSLYIDWCHYRIHNDEHSDQDKNTEISDYLLKLQAIWNLQHIKYLRLSNFPFQEIPNEIGNLTTLECLELDSFPELTELPDGIGRLSNLKTLKVSRCYKLQSLPPALGDLQELVELESDGNYRLQRIPADIGRLQNLKILKISHASDSLTLPSEIGRLRHLEVLTLTILSGVHTLPVGFGSSLLPSLQHLQMFGCKDGLNIDKVTNLDLQNLKSIRLSKIENLPLELKETPSLESMHVTGVPHDALVRFLREPWPADSTIETMVFTGIASKSAGDCTLRADYSNILTGLPRTLSHLNLANQGIESLDGFVEKGLPKGIRTLFLDGNPILKSTRKQDQACLERLLQTYPQLGQLGWDRHLHHMHPEYSPSRWHDPRYQLFTPSTTHLLLFNRCGRALLCSDSNSNNSIPLSLWPLVLARVRRALWENLTNVADRSMEYSVIYSLLQGPALLERPRE